MNVIDLVEHPTMRPEAQPNTQELFKNLADRVPALAEEIHALEARIVADNAHLRESLFAARDVLERLDRQMDLIIRNLPAIAKVAGNVEAKAMDRKIQALLLNNRTGTVEGTGRRGAK